MSPRAEHFDHGYVVGVLVNNQMDSSEDEDRLPDVIGATQVRPIFTRVLGQHKHPLREPEHGAHGMLVSSAPIKTGVMKSGHLTSDINPRGEALPDASPGIWLVTGIYNVDFGGHYPSFEIAVTSEHTKENPLDLWSAASDTLPPRTPSQTLLVPAGWSPGDVLGRDPETGELSWLGAQDLSGFVRDDDPRLSDARTPTSHRHPWTDLDDVPEIPSAPEDIGAQPAGDYLTASDLPAPPDLSDVVRDDDPRLSDAREPTAHSHPEYLTAEDVPEFPDLSAFVETDDSRLSDARTPLDHRHDMEDVEGLAASLADFQPRGEYLVPGDLPDLSDVVREDDERLSDARTPTDHRHTWSDLDDTPAIPASPEDIGAQPAGDYLTAEDIPEAPDLSDVIREGDERLSDPRQPTSHRHPWTDLDDAPEIPSEPADIGAQPAGDYLTHGDLPEPPDLSDVVRDDDPRLSDARPPTEHDHDDRYVRTVNGTGPDENGDVAVEGGGGSQGPSHLSILASGNVTLPTEHPVLTIRADDPATLSIPEAPDGTVVTIHVAHGWENLTWAPGITVTGDSATTETWVVLVRAEGEWQALVSGESGGGSGGGSGILTGYGNPNTLGIEADTVGVLYADEANTDGAALWSADYIDRYDGTIWAVVNGYASKSLSAGGVSLYFVRYGSRLEGSVTAFLTESGNGEEVTLPASTIDFGEADQGFMGSPYACTLVLTLPGAMGAPPPVQLPPIVCVFTQIDRYVLHMPEIVIPAYTSSDPVIVMGFLELVAVTPWPVGSGGSVGV